MKKKMHMYFCTDTQCFTHRDMSDLGSSPPKTELRTSLSSTWENWMAAAQEIS